MINVHKQAYLLRTRKRTQRKDRSINAKEEEKPKKKQRHVNIGGKKSRELPKVLERKKEKRVKTCKAEERTALKVQVAFQRRACLQHFFTTLFLRLRCYSF